VYDDYGDDNDVAWGARGFGGCWFEVCGCRDESGKIFQFLVGEGWSMQIISIRAGL